MPRFFAASSDINDGRITIGGEDAGHISRVLRMKPGEHVTVCDDNGIEYDTVVESTGSEVILEITGSHPSVNEPPYRAHIFQALVKGDRFDTVIQKATELGAYDFYPVITSRCMMKIEKKDYEKRTERWQRIAYEAAKQCGRAIIPKVHEPVEFADALMVASASDIPLFCYEGEGTSPLPELFPDLVPASVSVMIGPEGGWSEDEADDAKNGGMSMAGLGHRILRTETAAPFVLACTSYKYELTVR